MPLSISFDSGAGHVTITYDLDWLSEVMFSSAYSMVPFGSAATGPSIHDRSYPRSAHTGFTLFGEEKPNTDASSGGRAATYADGTQLVKLLALDADAPLPLGDVAVLAKRAVCGQVHQGKVANLKLRGGLPESDTKGVVDPLLLHGYPMLCIMLVAGKAVPAKYLKDQGVLRTFQCVFGASLTQALRAAGLGIEVVAREGFGSLFPTLADLTLSDAPGGIRLDPGLLPSKAGASAIEHALLTLDEFITRWAPGLDKAVPKWVGQMAGMKQEHLAAVDRLTSHLHGNAGKPPTPAGAFVAALSSFNGTGCDYDLPPIVSTGPVVVTLPCPPIPKDPCLTMRRRKQVDLGYGDESDNEDEEDEVEDEDDVGAKGASQLTTTKPKPKPKPKDSLFALKKYTVVSGMAALRMAVRYGMMYASAVERRPSGGTEGREEALTEAPKGEDITTVAAYFELELDPITKLMPIDRRAGVRMLVLDGAPNPVNAPGTAPSTKALGGMGVVVADTTNNTSKEKADFLLQLRKLLKAPDSGVVILVDSGSKHPTGGDLLHGVLRVCGSRRAVDNFHGLMAGHMKDGARRGQTALTSAEAETQLALAAHRIVARNRDLLRWLP